MSNKAIINRVIEALEARGFSRAESVQMVQRIRDGKDQDLDQIAELGAETIDQSYAAGYKEGIKEGLRRAEASGSANSYGEAVSRQTQEFWRQYQNTYNYQSYASCAQAAANSERSFWSKIFS